MSRSKPKPTGDSVEHRTQRACARTHRKHLEREHYALQLDQLHAADALPGDSLDLMHTTAMCDGIRIGKPGDEIAKLAGHGFVEISTANGQGRHRQGHAGGADLSA